MSTFVTYVILRYELLNGYLDITKHLASISSYNTTYITMFNGVIDITNHGYIYCNGGSIL